MKKRRKLLALLLSVTFILSLATPMVFAAKNNEADIIYINGTIYTVNDNAPIVSSMAIKEDKFMAVGSYSDVKNHIGSNTKVIDLKGKTVIPGLVEAHLHYPGIGESMLQIDAFWKPKEEILESVAEAYKSAQSDEWITGRGWNQEVWNPAAFPAKENLDAIAPDIPVYLRRTCGHAAWVNSKALEIAGIDKDTPDPIGGEILRDENGEATGILTDTAAYLVSQHIPSLSERQQFMALELAQEHLFSYGITSAHDAGTELSTINKMKQLYDSEDLKIRLYVMASPGETAEFFYQQTPEERIGLYNNRLTVRTLKLMGDGSLGARSAWMLEEYTDRPDHVGNGRYTDEEAYTYVKAARQAGFQVATHAIGDATNRQILDAYEKVLKEIPDPDHRYRIEHAQVIALEDIPRFAELGVLPSMQSVHATSDKNMAEDRVGPERIKGAYAWRKLINAGSILPNGSDAPVELVNPYHGIYAAVTRKDRAGDPKGGWYAEECLTREEALQSFTIWGAFAAFEEDIKGSIEVGKLADFAVIDRDPMTCPEADLKDILVLMTVVGGEVVYERPVADEITVMLNGEIINLNQAPFIHEGRILVPAEETLQKMDLDLESFSVEVSTEVVNEETYIYLKSLSEALGCVITWYGDSQTVSLNL